MRDGCKPWVHTRALTDQYKGSRKENIIIQVQILNIIGENTFSATLKVHLEKMLKCRPGLTSP